MSGLKFNSIPSQLGIATNYRDYMVYKRNNISDPISMELAGLLSHLVDAAKGGLTFDADDFRTWKKNNHLQMEYEKPAYKSHYPPERMENILDRLEFNVVRKMMAQTRREFSKKAEEIPTYDSDLTIVWKSEQERAASDPALKAILTDLCKKFEPLWPYFVDNCRRSDDDPNPYATKKSKQKSGPNISAANHLRQMFLDITPLQLSGPDQSTFHPLLSIPHNSSSLYDHLWLLIKASALYMKFHNKRSVFPWVVCGKELAELKAREVARRNGSTPMVVIEEMYLGLKPDRKYVGGVKRKRGEMGGDDSFGDDGDDGDVDGDDYGD